MQLFHMVQIPNHSRRYSEATMTNRTQAKLLHPRRSLGNRHRSQAVKFLKIAENDTSSRISNLHWAEQSSRQSVLHDFTNEENWRTLIDIKILLSDELGIRAVIEDLFVILGRDPERTNILTGIDLISHGRDLVDAAFIVDPLDPDNWYQMIGIDEIKFNEFRNRLTKLDLRDPRANIIFGRRIEKLYDKGRYDEFIPLARRIVAQRPQNHEAWTGLGRLHERREEYDEAWLCYDQAQVHFPSRPVRDEYRQRMHAKLEGEKLSWKPPDVKSRTDFLNRMFALSKPEVVSAIEDSPDIPDEIEQDERKILSELLESGDAQSALFMSRRLIANGEIWAQEFYDLAMKNLG